MPGRTVTRNVPVQSELSEILMYFVHNQASILHKAIQKIDGEHISSKKLREPKGHVKEKTREPVTTIEHHNKLLLNLHCAVLELVQHLKQEDEEKMTSHLHDSKSCLSTVCRISTERGEKG
ncbi:hypothetical protein TNCV_1871551 [Trichonephila clavipes]|nr:hypothetical protein TNCV_1871551 [Trichonephila clavipes]